MVLGYEIEFVLLFALALLTAGVVAGILAGLLGVGGGIVIVPVLFHLLSALGVDDAVRMHIAVGTSLATIIPTSIRSTLSHRKKGAVDEDILRSWAVPLVAGVLIGTIAADFSSGQMLTLIFAVVALLAAFNMAYAKEEWRLGEHLPDGSTKNGMVGVMGFFCAMMGIGGGTFGVTAMTLFGVPIHRAVGTAAGLGLIIAIPGTIGFIISGWGAPLRPPLSLGYVNLLGFALIVPATVLAAPLGVRLAHWMDRTTLKRAFALFLAITSVRMFWDLWGG